MPDESSEHFSAEEEEVFRELNAVVMVRIDLALSAQLNIQKLFGIKKKSEQKEKKTKDAAEVAIKQAEATAQKEFEKHKSSQKIERARKLFWFEKFDWFISSENYLVLAGKNAQQNEALVKRYMRKEDIYMHAEHFASSASCVIKNARGGPIPPITLNEAAIFTACHSKAWDSKVIVSVYWVHADQVSKTAQSGEYLVQGSFMVRGKKNYMQPSKMELGFTVMFCLSEESIGNHLGERRVRAEEAASEVATEGPEEGEDFAEFPDEEETGLVSQASNLSLEPV